MFFANDSHNTVTSIKATASDGTVTTFPKDVPMLGNDNAIIQLLSHSSGKKSCNFTIEVSFNRGESLTVTDFDACKASSFHPGQAMRTGRRLAKN